jgi:acyl-CoA synthetase (AMP-forming)/AMP-acid ligase II
VRDSLESLGLIEPPQRREIPGGGPQTVAEILDAPLVATPEHMALVGRSGRYRFAELEREVNRAAHTLEVLGIGEGDCVAACLPNDVDVVIAFLAAQRIGAIWVGINRPLAAPEKAYILRDAGSRLLLTDSATARSLDSHRAELPELASVEIVDPAPGVTGWREQVAAGADARPVVEIDAFAPAAIAYTSGTTGFPKGAVHSQHNMLLVAASQNRTGSLRPGVTVGMIMPLNILNLMIRGPLAAYYGGRTLACLDRHDPESIAKWVRQERIGSFDSVPTIVRDLLTHPRVQASDLESLVDLVVGGADCPPEIAALYSKHFGRAVTIGYGMTEAPTGVARTAGEEPPAPGYCGVAVPQVELSIVDENDRELPPGEVGEICVAPATEGEFAHVYTPMLGYWRRGEASREALRNGVYHTGDLGFLDQDGCLYVRGRRNELILRGGSNVYPAEVERVLLEHEAVDGAAVLGIPDERLGERVVAAVKCRPTAEVDEDSLRAHMQARLARYKIPDRIRFVDELPRNAMQKVLKHELMPLFTDPE